VSDREQKGKKYNIKTTENLRLSGLKGHRVVEPTEKNSLTRMLGSNDVKSNAK